MHTTGSLVALLVLFVGGCARPDRPPVTTPTTTAPDKDTTPAADVAPIETPAASFVAGPGGVPLPSDAVQNTEMPSLGGRMNVFEVPRSLQSVSDELKANLVADGWTIDSEELSPSDRAVRLKVSKDGTTIDARVTGTDTEAGIIIMLPAKG